MKTKKIIVKNVIKREKDFLYYIDKEGNLCGVKLQRGRKKGQIGNKNKPIKLYGDERYF